MLINIKTKRPENCMKCPFCKVSFRDEFFGDTSKFDRCCILLENMSEDEHYEEKHCRDKRSENIIEDWKNCPLETASIQRLNNTAMNIDELNEYLTSNSDDVFVSLNTLKNKVLNDAITEITKDLITTGWIQCENSVQPEFIDKFKKQFMRELTNYIKLAELSGLTVNMKQAVPLPATIGNINITTLEEWNMFCKAMTLFHDIKAK